MTEIPNRIRASLDDALALRQLTPVPSGGNQALYCASGYDQVLFLLSLQLDAHSGLLTGTHMVEPLPTAAEVSIAERSLIDRLGGGSRGHLGRQRITHSEGRLLELAPDIARVASGEQMVLRERFDGAAKFAKSVDDEYLADDWPELAEAVAYMWLAADEVQRAATRLRSIAAREDMIEPALQQRADRMWHMILAHPDRARETLSELRRAKLDRYGLA
jgi:hypothetical protein